jgi:host factor-I protein
MEDETGNLQNEFFNTVRKERTLVAVFLGSGKRLVGRVKAFDRFTILLESSYGEQIVFKHAISTVSLAHHGEPRGEGEPHSRSREDAPRERYPREGSPVGRGPRS